MWQSAMPEEARALAARLKRLRALKREIDALAQRAAQVERQALGDGARARGRALEAQDVAEGLRKIQERLLQRQRESMEELGVLYALIDDIEDAQLRAIFSYRYIDGLRWQQVAYRIGHYDEQYPRKKHNAYLCALAGVDAPPCGAKKGRSSGVGEEVPVPAATKETRVGNDARRQP